MYIFDKEDEKWKVVSHIKYSGATLLVEYGNIMTGDTSISVNIQGLSNIQYPTGSAMTFIIESGITYTRDYVAFEIDNTMDQKQIVYFGGSECDMTITTNKATIKEKIKIK